MVFEQIEKLKRDYTDKYVKVDADRPELARFKDVVGQVKTVNMSGRALVEFCDYFDNIGWYDIDLNYLQVVDKPAPKQEEAKPARKATAPAAKAAPAAAGEKKLSPLEMARMQGAAKKAPAGEAPPAAPAAGKKLSVAEMMAAARAEKKPAAEPTAEATPPVAEAAAPAAPQEVPAAKPAGEKVDRSKMSVAEMIAMAKARDAKK